MNGDGRIVVKQSILLAAGGAYANANGGYSSCRSSRYASTRVLQRSIPTPNSKSGHDGDVDWMHAHMAADTGVRDVQGRVLLG